MEGNASDDHVGAPDRLDLLDAVVFGEFVPVCEHAVGKRHHIRRGEPTA